MRRYNRDERRYDRDEPSGGDPESSERRRFPWDDPASDPAEAGDPAPEWTDTPTDPDSRSSQALEEFPADSVPEEVRAGEQDTSEAPGEFPWQESAGADQPPQVWEEPPAEQSAASGGGVATGDSAGRQGNPLAITGFILSLVMWIALIIPPLSFVLWILALTFSSIGLSRSRKSGLPHKGLAIAGLCISLVGLVIVVVFILFLVGTAVVSTA